MGILAFVLFGLVVGLLARALMPESQSMGLVMTALLGIVGAFVGGVVGSIIYGGRLFELNAAGVVGSVLGAMAVMLLVGMAGRRRALT